MVGAIRATDRVGKGLRSAPRDVMLAGSAPADRRASVFGFHRAMDHGGAAMGSLLAWGALHYLHWDIRTIFLACVVPGIATLLLLGFGLKEEQAVRPPPREEIVEDAPLSRQFQIFLAGIGLAGLGAGSESFLLLAAGGSQVPLEELPLLWLGLHLIKSFSSGGAGPLADRIGHRSLVIAGRVVHAAVFLGFALTTSPAWIIALFLIHGLHQGLTEGSEKAMVADMAPPDARGKAFGAWNLVSGLVALPASAMFGFLWEEVSRPVAFEVATVLTVVAIGILAMVKKGS
jgi:MFS family permease